MRRSTGRDHDRGVLRRGPRVPVAGLGPWLITRWEMREPLPYWAVAQAVGALMIVVGLVPAVHAFVEFAPGRRHPDPGRADTAARRQRVQPVCPQPDVHRAADRHHRPGTAVRAAGPAAVRRGVLARHGDVRPLVRGADAVISVRRGVRGLPALRSGLDTSPAPVDTGRHRVVTPRSSAEGQELEGGEQDRGVDRPQCPRAVGRMG